MDIPDLFPGHSKDLFCIPAHYYHSISEVLIPYGIIQDRVRKIARNILKTILEEEDSAEDSTRNICLDAESLILTKEEEEVTILDLMTDEKNNFEDTFKDQFEDQHQVFCNASASAEGVHPLHLHSENQHLLPSVTPENQVS